MSWLYILLVIFSIALIVLIAYGVYFLVVIIQTAIFDKLLNNFWSICLLSYYYMNSSQRKMFESKLSNAINTTIELSGVEIDETEEDKKIKLTMLKELLVDENKNFEKKSKKILSNVKEQFSESIDRVRRVYGIITEILI